MQPVRLTAKRLATVIVVSAAAGWWLGSAPSSPLNPDPKRPLVAAVAKLARSAARIGLWLTVYGNPAPTQHPKEDQSANEIRRLVQAHRVDDTGNRILDNSEGW